MKINAIMWGSMLSAFARPVRIILVEDADAIHARQGQPGKSGMNLCPGRIWKRI